MIFSSSVVYASLISNVHAAEITSQQKALSTLSDVVGFDISKYNNIPVAYPNDFYRDTFPRENVRCNLDSADSKVDALCTFINGSLQMIEIFNNTGSPYMTKAADNAAEMAQNLLSNYQTQTKNSLYGELNSLLAEVDANKNSTITAENIKLKVIVSEDDTTFRWIYTLNGIEAPDKCVTLGIRMVFLNISLITGTSTKLAIQR